MSVRAAKIVPRSERLKIEQVVVGFDAEKLKAPFLLRCGALLIDYIVMIIVPVTSLLIGRFAGKDGSKLLNSEISNVGWLIFVLLGLTNIFIFPMFLGQSLGKMFTGIRIVRSDGKAAGFGSILFRHLIGYPITFLTGGIGFLLSAFTSTGKALHDYFGDSVVVYADRKVRPKNKSIGRAKFNKKRERKGDNSSR